MGIAIKQYICGVNILQSFDDAAYAKSGAGMVGAFLEAIKNEDALNFWSMLDNKGQGYFMGMWFFALGNSDIAGISLLTENEDFLHDALKGIIADLKSNLGKVLDNPQLGELQYTDSHHGQVPVTVKDGTEDQPLTEYIPLVLELAPAGAAGKDANGGNVGMTCWKIDTLKCFSIQKM